MNFYSGIEPQFYAKLHVIKPYFFRELNRRNSWVYTELYYFSIRRFMQIWEGGCLCMIGLPPLSAFLCIDLSSRFE